MATIQKNWFDVDRTGLRQLLASRGKEFIVFELIQNGWDEPITKIAVSLTRPAGGRSELVVTDDSPDGFKNLAHAYTLYAPSSKKADPKQRGRFNQGEKAVLALCEEAWITSTTGQIAFNKYGRKKTKRTTGTGTEFRANIRLTVDEWEQINRKILLLLPDVLTTYNGIEIPQRQPLAQFNTTLPTVDADAEGNLRLRKRAALVRIYQPFENETPMLYELGIPVVETGDTWHVSIEQKVPLNQDRDNVTPAYLAAVRVAVLNHMSLAVTPEMATEAWVRAASGDARVESYAFKDVLQARFGERAVSFDPSDIGSNREASSQNYTVVTGGSLSAGEWENARRTGTLHPAGRLFPTNHGTKDPDKRFSRTEWTEEMRSYAEFVEAVSPHLVGKVVTVEYIEDPQMVCGQFFGSHFNVNLAQIGIRNREECIRLMLHELSHTEVPTNDHLSHEFRRALERIGARLALIAARVPWLSR